MMYGSVQYPMDMSTTHIYTRSREALYSVREICFSDMEITNRQIQLGVTVIRINLISGTFSGNNALHLRSPDCCFRFTPFVMFV